MKEATCSVKENKLFKVPLVVDGKQNGTITATVEVTSDNADYIEDKNFIVTSYTVSIPASKKEVSIEIIPVDDREINTSARTLSVKIVDVKGAKINTDNAICNVSIVDNDDNPYERLAGKWTAYITDGFSGTGMAWETEITTYDEEEENYGRELLVAPLCDASGSAIALEDGSMVALPIKFRSIKSGNTETVELKIECGTVIAEGVNFDSTGEDLALQDCRLRIVTLGAVGIVNTGSITGRIDETTNTISFDMPVLCEIVTKTNQVYSYLFYYDSLRFVLKN
jgi:hypothetical protein